MAQSPSRATTRYDAVRRPHEREGYSQRIAMWDAVKHLGSANRFQLLTELRDRRYERPGGGILDESYCRIELTDMTRRGHLRRIHD